MPATVNQFITSLTNAGILTAEEVSAVQETRIGDQELVNEADAQSLAAELVRRNKLTEYQAKVLYDGGATGLVLGSYVIMDEIGTGGMGRVYKAHHRRMKRTVALKVLNAAAVQSSDAVRRFQREVEAAAKLSHPNIVTAYDADEAQGVHYLVMEFVSGVQLSPTGPDGQPLTVQQALEYVLQVSRGLRYAHQHGVVHRDIKPANLLLDTEGTIKILDMGLARLEEPGAEQTAAAQKLTQAGQIMGTVDFMSPEQAEDTRQADSRADIYSLGCTLFTLLVGKPIYEEDTVMKKLLAHREQAIPRLSERRRDVPRQLDDVLRRMVAKKPADRYQTMDEVLLALAAVYDQVTGASPGSGIYGKASRSGIVSFGKTQSPPGFRPPSDSNLFGVPEKPAGSEGRLDQGDDEELMLQEDADELAKQKETQAKVDAKAKGKADAKAKADAMARAAAKAGQRAPKPLTRPAEPAATSGSSDHVELIHITCECGKKMVAKPHLAGKRVRCSKCGAVVQIPHASPSPDAATPGVASAETAAPRKIEVACKCGKRFLASESMAGKTAKCSKCGSPVVIPAK